MSAAPSGMNLTMTPAAIAASRSAPFSVGPASRTEVATTALVRKGTGATARPSSSRTTAASRADEPAPP